LFVVLAVITDGAYALLAGAAGNWLRRNQRFLRAQRYLAGGMYVGLGVAAAVSGTGRE
jgi:threonine/homoserine/homoserine lactone efflux protein